MNWLLALAVGVGIGVMSADADYNRNRENKDKAWDDAHSKFIKATDDLTKLTKGTVTKPTKSTLNRQKKITDLLFPEV